MKKQKPVLVALDAGSGNVAMRFLDDNNELKQFIMPSLIRSGKMQRGSKASTSTWITDNGAVYSVTSTGSRQQLINTLDPAYQIGDAHRVLVHDALAKAGLSGREVIIADTLPADQYFHANQDINFDRIELKKESLMKPVTNESGLVPPAKVIKVTVFPEAVPAFVSCLYKDDGTTEKAFDKCTSSIVVDIGRFTNDMARLDENNEVIDRRTTENGIHVMIDRVHTLIQENEKTLGLKETKEIDTASLDKFIRNGYIGSEAESQKEYRVDIRPIVRQAAQELVNAIEEDIRSMHRNLLDIDILVFVGGGANWLGGGLGDDYVPNLAKQWHNNVFIPENPEMAIVRGVHLMMLDDAESESEVQPVAVTEKAELPEE